MKAISHGRGTHSWLACMSKTNALKLQNLLKLNKLYKHAVRFKKDKMLICGCWRRLGMWLTATTQVMIASLAKNWLLIMTGTDTQSNPWLSTLSMIWWLSTAATYGTITKSLALMKDQNLSSRGGIMASTMRSIWMCFCWPMTQWLLATVVIYLIRIRKSTKAS